MKTFFKNLEYRFLVESAKIENALFHTKLPYQTPVLRPIKWWLQNGPITKKGVLPLITLLFLKFSFSLNTSYTALIFFTNNPSVYICTFWKRWNFIWRHFFPVSILKIKSYHEKAMNFIITEKKGKK